MLNVPSNLSILNSLKYLSKECPNAMSMDEEMKGILKDIQGTHPEVAVKIELFFKKMQSNLRNLESLIQNNNEDAKMNDEVSESNLSASIPTSQLSTIPVQDNPLITVPVPAPVPVPVPIRKRKFGEETIKELRDQLKKNKSPTQKFQICVQIKNYVHEKGGLGEFDNTSRCFYNETIRDLMICFEEHCDSNVQTLIENTNGLRRLFLYL